ncbi:MAG: hypothetical protein QXW98_05180 [Candidatus Caldarchaeum sp.]
MKAKLVCSGGIFYIEKDCHIVSIDKIDYAEKNSISISRRGLAIRKLCETYDCIEDEDEEFDIPVVHSEVFECIMNAKSNVASSSFDTEVCD